MEGIDIANPYVGIAVGLTYFVGIPLAVGVLNLACKWVDCGKNSFTYPAIWEFPGYRFMKEKVERENSGEAVMLFSTAGLFVTGIFCLGLWEFLFAIPAIPLSVAAAVILAVIAKRVNK